MGKIFENVKEEKVEYFVVGNREFKTEKEAEEFIRVAKEKLSMTYFNITFHPDLTEGRGYYREMTIATNSELGVNLVYDFLSKLLGNAIAWVQGVSPMPNYIISEGKKFEDYDELERYLNDFYTKLGSHTPTKRPLTILKHPENEEYTPISEEELINQLSFK